MNRRAALLNERRGSTNVRQSHAPVRQKGAAVRGASPSRLTMRWPARVSRNLLAVSLAWTAAGVFFITRESLMRLYRGERVPWGPISIGWLASVYIWAALTPAILWAGRRWPLDGGGRSRWRHVAMHAGLSALLS